MFRTCFSSVFSCWRRDAISKAASLRNESFRRPRTTLSWRRLFSTGVLIIIRGWETSHGWALRLSAGLPPGANPVLEDKGIGEPAVTSKACLGLKSECWHPGSCYTFVWVEFQARAFWKHFFLSAFAMSTLKGRDGRQDLSLRRHQRASGTPLAASVSQGISGTRQAQASPWRRGGWWGGWSVTGPASRPQPSPGAPGRICSSTRYSGAAAPFWWSKQGKANPES